MAHAERKKPNARYVWRAAQLCASAGVMRESEPSSAFFSPSRAETSSPRTCAVRATWRSTSAGVGGFFAANTTKCEASRICAWLYETGCNCFRTSGEVTTTNVHGWRPYDDG